MTSWAEREERFRLFIETVTDYALLMLDPKGVITTWNAGARRIKGYAPAEIIGQHFSKFYPEDDVRAGKCEHELEIANAEGRFEEEGWRVKKDGSRFWASVTITTIRDPQTAELLGYAKVTRDLSERKRADEVLRQSEERFRLLIESVGDYAIFMLDPKGIITTWNKGAEKIKGYKASEIIGQHFSKFYPEEDVLAGKCDRELEIAADVGRFEEEGWRIRKNGKQMWANVVITAMRDAKTQSLLGFSKVTRDLTERRSAELQRLELVKAKEAIRLRDEFISIASHELRTPLSTLRLQADTMVRGLSMGKLSIERVPEKIGVMSAQVSRLERLITQLLDVSRIEAGRLKLDLEPVDAAALVKDVVASLQDPLDRAGCQVHVDTPAEALGDWDRNRLEQVLTNLLVNASKYGAGKPIKVVVQDEGARVTISVQDQGIGVEPEQHERIFERFERATDNKHYGGFGLGLWLSKQIVDSLNGTIQVASALGSGATFSVTLPKSRAP